MRLAQFVCLIATFGLVGCVDTPSTPASVPAATPNPSCLRNSVVDCMPYPALTNLATGQKLHPSATSWTQAIHLASVATGTTLGIPYSLTNEASPILAAAVQISQVTLVTKSTEDPPAIECIRSDGLACSDPKATWKAIVPADMKAGPEQTTAQNVQVTIRHQAGPLPAAKLCFHFYPALLQNKPICLAIQTDMVP